MAILSGLAALCSRPPGTLAPHGGLKVIASIVAISAIALLRSFLLLGDPATPVDVQRLRWMVLIQLTFVASGVLLALMDRISARAFR